MNSSAILVHLTFHSARRTLNLINRNQCDCSRAKSRSNTKHGAQSTQHRARTGSAQYEDEAEDGGARVGASECCKESRFNALPELRQKPRRRNTNEKKKIERAINPLTVSRSARSIGEGSRGMSERRFVCLSSCRAAKMSDDDELCERGKLAAANKVESRVGKSGKARTIAAIWPRRAFSATRSACQLAFSFLPAASGSDGAD